MPNLTGITALDVAIGLAFVFLLFSLLCSVVMEAIAGFLDLRARTLEEGLRNLLDDDGAGASAGAPAAATPAAPGPTPEGQPIAAPGVTPPALSTLLLGHGLIRTQYKSAKFARNRRRRGPSYLPPRMFAVALLDVVESQATSPNPGANLQMTIASSNIPQGTKNALLALAKDVGNDADALRERVEQWFDSGMDRVSGWYKRKTQLIVGALSLLVAVLLNVNTIAIADRLVRDDVVRTAVVAEATRPADEPAAESARATRVEQAPAPPVPGSTASMEKVAEQISNVKKLGLPLGWDLPEGDPAKPALNFTTGLGWLITFLALSLGAPFWFDALARLGALRSAGVKPKPATSAP